MTALKIVLALAALTFAPLASAGLGDQPCTCDPSPIGCLFTDGSSTTQSGCSSPMPTLPGVPQPDAKQLVHDLDPRNWPCTCDPVPVLS